MGAGDVARVDDKIGPVDELLVVDVAVSSGDEGGVEGGDGFLGPGDALGAGPVGVFAGGFYYRDVGVVVGDFPPSFFDHVHEDVAGGFAVVVDVGFVG